ncbi:MAG TPA: malonic semialdehyde reductase [Burkholderiaceae bacterium]|nr:malonic semialdehyde reductase [Burkholderiaceae bacterium]
MSTLDQAALDTLFFNARTHNGWQDRPVDDALLKRLFDTLKWAPTSANCSPLRLQFVKSEAARARLVPLMMPGNQDKVRSAPVTAILGMDMAFYEHLPKLFPHTDARSWFAGNEEAIRSTAFRNSSLQGGYFILAARALGLDCGPMSGFDAAGVDAAFWAGSTVKTNFICSLGHGDPAKLFARSPRFEFDEVCKIV